MYVRFDHQRRRLYVALVINRLVDGSARQKRLGYLGRVIFSEPIAASERVKFWLALNQRLLAIRARHPIVSVADEAKIREAVEARIPRPTKPELQEAIDEMAREIEAISRAA